MAETDEHEWDEQSVYGPSTVIAALDSIEDLVHAARAVPLSAAIMVNKAELLDLIDQAREALPDDLVQADAVVADADAVLGRADSAAEVTIAEANTRARTTLDEARDKAEHLVADATEKAETTLIHAEQDAQRVREEAKREAEEILQDANVQAERLVSAENITIMAKERAQQLVAEARRADAQLRSGADDYAAKSLAELSKLLGDLQRRTDAGRRAIADRTGVDRTNVTLDDE
ncbi:hypothetical protein I6B53_07085 [Schaalia sp. 19OD2882]|uniref:hypothetical protein n=1 Tax=Schaalia sp. 19OD2882 TaxID=2794089 RepID=UPI001C1EC976|nr:hypothetical protein [Schaalia sp. 19OD2882]QWW18906.1 hypothetical protein I6B53_07085 [Schaalia sp. 19OD2882]